MTKIIYFLTIVCFLTSCYDKFYAEGRIETISATEITNHSAVLKGKIEILTAGEKADLNVKSRGFVYGTGSHSLVNTITDGVTGEGDFTGNAIGLLPNTRYYARAFALIEGKVNEKSQKRYYGNIIEFTTDNRALPPSVTTQAASNITANGARLNGTIVSAGYPSYSERGFVYGNISNPRLENATVIQVMGSGTGEFYSDIIGLTTDVIYYTRAYATNSEGTVYGEQVSFTPTVSTGYVVLQMDGIMVQTNDLSSGANWNTARNLCQNSQIGGFSDWRLPTEGELQTLYRLRTTIGGLTAGFYWGNERNSSWAGLYIVLDISNAQLTYHDSSASNRVRAVRTLP